MSFRRPLFVFPVLCAGMLVLLSHSTAAAGFPNIIVIHTDDIGYGDVGCYGATLPAAEISPLASQSLAQRQREQ